MSVFWYSILSVLIVNLVALVGIGAFTIKDAWLKKILHGLVGLSAGALLGDAVIHLIPESLAEISNQALFGLSVLAGIVVFFILEKYLRWHHAHHGKEEEHSNEEKHHHPRHLAPLVLISDGIHNAVDGAVIAASFLISVPVGIATTVAVFLHEIPQEISDYALLIHSGFSKSRALFFNFLSGLTAFVGAALVLLYSENMLSIGPLLAAFTAGAFIYIAATDLIPELQMTKDPKRSAVELISFLLGIGIMFSLLVFSSV